MVGILYIMNTTYRGGLQEKNYREHAVYDPRDRNALAASRTRLLLEQREDQVRLANRWLL